MSRIRSDRVLSIDLELTCWAPGECPPGEVPDIIEIGIAEADLATLQITRSARFLTKPTRSRISNFCASFTGITEDLMKQDGVPFAEALRSIGKAYGPGSKTCVAWGSDVATVVRECERLGEPCPFSLENSLNLGQAMTLMFGAERRLGQSEALEALGLTVSGEQHRGETDARDALRVFLGISERIRASLPDFGPKTGTVLG